MSTVRRLGFPARCREVRDTCTRAGRSSHKAERNRSAASSDGRCRTRSLRARTCGPSPALDESGTTFPAFPSPAPSSGEGGAWRSVEGGESRSRGVMRSEQSASSSRFLASLLAKCMGYPIGHNYWYNHTRFLYSKKWSMYAYAKLLVQSRFLYSTNVQLCSCMRRVYVSVSSIVMVLFFVRVCVGGTRRYLCIPGTSTTEHVHSYR
jgi:hypothetical protein